MTILFQHLSTIVSLKYFLYNIVNHQTSLTCLVITNFPEDNDKIFSVCKVSAEVLACVWRRCGGWPRTGAWPRPRRWAPCPRCGRACRGPRTRASPGPMASLTSSAVRLHSVFILASYFLSGDKTFGSSGFRLNPLKALLVATLATVQWRFLYYSPACPWSPHCSKHTPTSLITVTF